MCRWFAYFSTDERKILLEDALVYPVHAITQQARGDFQEENLLNADGFGVAWYSDTLSKFENQKSVGKKEVFGAHPILYRSTTGKPINDITFRYLCRSTSSNVVLSHIRGAFGIVTDTNNHPFVFGRSSFVHNGFIARFKDIRTDMMDGKIMMWKHSKKINGSTDTEHLAALYFSYLDEEKPQGYFDDDQKEKKYSASSMWKAMQKTVQEIEKIQQKNFGLKLNNTLNLCATNGESMVSLCYRTNPWAPPNTLYVSFTVGDEMDRKSTSYRGNKDKRNDQELEKASKDFKNNVEDLREADLESQDIKHVIVSSEPVTFESDDWYKMCSGQAILVDNLKNEALQVTLQHMSTARVTAVMHPNKENQVIMFHNNLLAVIDVSGPIKKVLGRTVEITTAFKENLDLLNGSELSSGCDAVIPIAGDPGKPLRWHMFCGKEYMLVEVNAEGNVPTFRIVKKPTIIGDVWGCFEGKFETIDTAISVPNSPNEAWFFSGDQYAHVSWTQHDNGDITASIFKNGPSKIITEWKSLDRAGFNTVNMTLFNWNQKEETAHQIYFFSGNHVVLVDVKLGRGGKFIDKSRGKRRPVSQDWPPGFYEPPNAIAVPAFNDLGDEDTTLLANMIDPLNENRLFFFFGSSFIVLDTEKKPYAIVLGPQQILQSCLGGLGGQIWTSGLDAVLPNPPKKGEVLHLFSGNQCAAVDLPPKMVLQQSAECIIKRWTCLEKAEFTSIDSVVQVPGVENQVWFFSRTQYIRAEWKQDKEGKVDSKMIGKPKDIREGWPALKKTKLFQVESILPVPGKREAWFFFDSQCLRISLKSDPNDSEILELPKPITEVWPGIDSLADWL